jgi:uncharacterized protein YwqG
MSPEHRLSFIKADHAIVDSMTKFGGQPIWLDKPTWPTSRSTSQPMRFIGQVELTSSLFPHSRARVAYFFMTDLEDGTYVDGTWEPDGGENAVVLQPGECRHPHLAQGTGPSITGTGLGQSEFRVVLEPTNEARNSDGEVRPELINKVGGPPDFLQGDETPFSGVADLILQLDSSQAPFDVNFGDAGVGYAFMNQDGTDAKFLWQCS